MVPKYLAYLTLCISRNSSQFSDNKLPQGFTLFTAVLNPTAFAIVQIDASNMVHGGELLVPARSLRPEKMKQPQRGRQLKHIGQAARTPRCEGSLE